MMLRTHIEFSLLTSQEGRAIPKLVAEIIMGIEEN